MRLYTTPCLLFLICACGERVDGGQSGSEPSLCIELTSGPVDIDQTHQDVGFAPSDAFNVVKRASVATIDSSNVLISGQPVSLAFTRKENEPITYVTRKLRVEQSGFEIDMTQLNGANACPNIYKIPVNVQLNVGPEASSSGALIEGRFIASLESAADRTLILSASIPRSEVRGSIQPNLDSTRYPTIRLLLDVRGTLDPATVRAELSWQGASDTERMKEKIGTFSPYGTP